MFNKEEVVKKWTDCCSRTLPGVDTILASSVDPANIEHGVRINILQSQVDAMVSAITSTIVSENKKTLDKMDALLSEMRNVREAISTQTTNINLSRTAQVDRIVEAINNRVQP